MNYDRCIIVFSKCLTVHATNNKLVDLIINNFDTDEIKESKRVLCDNYDESFKVRKSTELRNEKYVHAQDIVDILVKLDSKNKVSMSSFVVDSAGLLRLPKVNLEDLSSLSCMIKLNSIIEKMECFNSTMKNNNEMLQNHNSRLIDLEKTNESHNFALIHHFFSLNQYILV